MAATKNKRKPATKGKATKTRKTKKESGNEEKKTNSIAICNIEFKNILPDGTKRIRKAVNYKETVSLTKKKKSSAAPTTKPEKVTKPKSKRVRTKEEKSK